MGFSFSDAWDAIVRFGGEVIDDIWPPDSEADVKALGQAWTDAATALRGAVTRSDNAANELLHTWPDAAGFDAYFNIHGYNNGRDGGDGVGKLADEMDQLAKSCTDYAAQIADAKNQVRLMILENLALFALSAAIPGGLELFAERMAAQIAARVAAVAARVGMDASKLAKIGKLALPVVRGAATQAANDVLSQEMSKIQGYRNNIDYRQTATAALGGALAGPMAAVAEHVPGVKQVTSLPGKALENLGVPEKLSTTVTRAATTAVTNGATAPLANVAASDIVNHKLDGFTSVRDYATKAAAAGVQTAADPHTYRQSPSGHPTAERPPEGPPGGDPPHNVPADPTLSHSPSAADPGAHAAESGGSTAHSETPAAETGHQSTAGTTDHAAGQSTQTTAPGVTESHSATTTGTESAAANNAANRAPAAETTATEQKAPAEAPKSEPVKTDPAKTETTQPEAKPEQSKQAEQSSQDPAKDQAKEPAKDPSKEPAKEPGKDPAKEPAKDPAKEAAKSHATDPAKAQVKPGKAPSAEPSSDGPGKPPTDPPGKPPAPPGEPPEHPPGSSEEPPENPPNAPGGQPPPPPGEHQRTPGSESPHPPGEPHAPQHEQFPGAEHLPDRARAAIDRLFEHLPDRERLGRKLAAMAANVCGRDRGRSFDDLVAQMTPAEHEALADRLAEAAAKEDSKRAAQEAKAAEAKKFLERLGTESGKGVGKERSPNHPEPVEPKVEEPPTSPDAGRRGRIDSLVNPPPAQHPAPHEPNPATANTGADHPGTEPLAQERHPEPDAMDPELAAQVDAVLADHPEVAAIVRGLAADEAHALNLTDALHDPARRAHALAVVAELADGRVLADRTLGEYLAAHPGKGPLFEPLPEHVNTTVDGHDRKQSYVDDARQLDEARGVGAEPSDAEHLAVEDYARRLKAAEKQVRAEIFALANQFDGAMASVRTKGADAILDKVGRMVHGSAGRGSRPNYRVGDVIDAIGGRITVRDTEQLGGLLQAVQRHFGTGDGGRILEIENMYAAPKSASPSYRVIPLIISVEHHGKPYTFELQLTTERASIAADINHNTIYKPYVRPTAEQRRRIEDMFAEAAALDQEETRRGPHG